MGIAILSICTLVAAIMAIVGAYRTDRTLHYICKPLATVFIIGIAATACLQGCTAYGWLILAGLVCGLAGDIFIMFHKRCFFAGLISFLIGNLLYIAAFATGIAVTASWPVVPALAFGIIVYGLLHAHLGTMRVPVIAYIVVILAMAAVALERLLALQTTGSLLATTGVAFFLVTDTTLALDRYRQSFRSAQLIILSTYWIAQWLIALSLALS